MSRRWHRHHHHHGPWAHGPPPEIWRRWYFHWKLRRRIFLWLVVAMLASGGSVMWLFRTLHSADHRASHWLLPLAVTFLVLWASAGVIAHRLSRPFMELERVARAIGRGDTSVRFSPVRAGGAESRIVGETINDMADRIQKQLADQRALLAAVSHEIRTPLARMRLLVEFAKDGAHSRAQNPLDELDGEIVEIDQLVSELLAASRIDFSALSPRDLDLVEIAKRAMDRAEVDRALLVSDAESITARGDATLVSRAISNLLENAKRHGGGVVRVRLGRRGAFLFLEVEDEGNGFAPGEEARAFEPFRKGPSSLSVGFGLALVRRIAESHGGSAYARNRKPKGALVGIELERSFV